MAAGLIRSRRAVLIRDLASLVGKFVLLEAAFGLPILVGTRIITIQIQEAAEQFGWKRGFLRFLDESKSALRRVVASLDLWNGCPIRTSETAITLTSVLANKSPSDIVRKIPNRKLFAA
jgi:hypothetical protein